MTEGWTELTRMVQTAIDVYSTMQKSPLDDAIRILMDQDEDVIATIIWLFKIKYNQ